MKFTSKSISFIESIKFKRLLRVKDANELFNEHDDLLHTVSLIPYPVFCKREEYTGHTPKLLKTPILLRYITDHFVDELSN